MKKILVVMALFALTLATKVAAAEPQTIKIGEDVWTETEAPAECAGAKVLSDQMVRQGANWLRLRIFVPFTQPGQEPTFFLEVTSGQPNTRFEILTSSRVGGDALWINVPVEQELNTGPTSRTQFQAVRLLSNAQFYQAQIIGQ